MRKFLSRQTDGSAAQRSDTATPTDLDQQPRPLRYWPFVAPVITLTMLLVLSVLWLAIQRSMRSLAATSLETVLTSNVAALRLWLGDRGTDAARLAADADVSTIAIEMFQLNARRQAPDGDARLRMLAEKLAAKIARTQLPSDYLGWALVDASGTVLAASTSALVPQSFSLSADVLNQIAVGQPTVVPAQPSPVALTSEGPLSVAGGPLMLTLAPIADGPATLGCIALLIDPTKQFSQYLQHAQMGDSGEVLVIDRGGRLLSPSRFESQLRAAGLLSETTSSILNVELRDPGVDVMAGERPHGAVADFPFTNMAEQATRGGWGKIVDGYTDYRGTPAIAIWQWLPEYGIAVVAKLNVDEAYRPAILASQAFLGVLAVVTLSGVSALLSALLYRRVADHVLNADRKVRRLGQYEIGELLGCGGMGSVYRGRHLLVRRDVAVKVLEGEQVNPRSVSRFEREVQMTARLRHPNTIDIYDYGHTTNGTFFYVMEYVDGITLQQLVDYYGAQPPERVIHLLLQVCGSLGEAHTEGLVHRDVKPSNVLITARAGLYDLVKVLDFGLVKDIDSLTNEITRAESLTGTPLYIAPEALRDASSATPLSDIYSVGAVGYTLLTGKPTFEGTSVVDLFVRQLNDDPIRPADRIDAELPDDLQNVLMSCLRKEPAERPHSMDDLVDLLRQCVSANLWTAAAARGWWDHVFERSPQDKIDSGRATLDDEAELEVLRDSLTTASREQFQTRDRLVDE